MGLATCSTHRHLEPEMSMEVPMDSPPKIPQKWRLFNFKASWTQGLLDSEGSFLQLIFTLI